MSELALRSKIEEERRAIFVFSEAWSVVGLKIKTMGAPTLIQTPAQLTELEYCGVRLRLVSNLALLGIVGSY